MQGDAAISLKGIVRYEKGLSEPILRSVSADLPAGRLIALAGADGAGKTTLMRVMAGLLKPQQGTVTMLGEPLYSDKLAELQNHCGYMPQQFGLYTDLSVRENLSLYADLFGLSETERRDRFDELLRMTALRPFTERPAGKLSGGMKQKLGLACALLNRPKILLLDEPSVGVDPLSRRELWTILKENVKTRAMTVVVATTYMDEASLCDDVVVLEEGRVVLHDSPQNIASMAEGLTYTLSVGTGLKVRDIQAQLLDDTDNIWDAVPRADGVRVLIKKGVDCETVEKKHSLHLKAVPPGLEDGYLVNRLHSKTLHPYSVIRDKKEQRAAESSVEAVVHARNLVRRFGSFTAVDRTSFDVYPGEIFGLLGPNGAGKTTTFKMLCGLLTVSDGELKVAGVDVLKAREEAREHLGYMCQKFAL